MGMTQQERQEFCRHCRFKKSRPINTRFDELTMIGDLSHATEQNIHLQRVNSRLRQDIKDLRVINTMLRITITKARGAVYKAIMGSFLIGGLIAIALLMPLTW